jgi:hypothetical protein
MVCEGVIEIFSHDSFVRSDSLFEHSLLNISLMCWLWNWARLSDIREMWRIFSAIRLLMLISSVHFQSWSGKPTLQPSVMLWPIRHVSISISHTLLRSRLCLLWQSASTINFFQFHSSPGGRSSSIQLRYVQASDSVGSHIFWSDCCCCFREISRAFSSQSTNCQFRVRGHVNVTDLSSEDEKHVTWELSWVRTNHNLNDCPIVNQTS